MSYTEKELEILAKVEEQNKALLADEKAICSLSSKRRAGSISSSLSTGSSTDGTKAESSTQSNSRSNGTSAISLPSLITWNNNPGPPPTAPLAEQWSHVVNNWDQFAKKRTFVAELICKGLPDEYRSTVWRLFTGAQATDLKRAYESYLEMTSPVERAIRRDIARTFPKHELFKEENGFGQESLFRVIKAYSLHDNEVGYCQGSGFIAGLLLMQLPEADAFAVFTQLMNKYQLREMYKPSMLQLGVCMYQLEKLLAEHIPDLHLHFLAHSLAPTLYASAWFLTLFSTILPIPMATRVMDLFIAEGLPFIFRMALAMLKFSVRRLLGADMESMVVYLQNEGPAEWGRHANILFENAASIKLNLRKMKKMEKEYMQIRSKEREEQIELRRLRTENGLLHQRIARLDEECTSMADRLVQSQLVRAQEAEAVLTLRCELSVMRRAMQNKASENGDNAEHVAPKANEVAKNATKPPSQPSQAETPVSDKPFTLTDSAAAHISPRRSVDGHVCDTWMLSTLSRLQTDLASSRAAEAEARLHFLDLKERYCTLQQTKAELSTESSDEISTLKSELCRLKLRDNANMTRLQELTDRLNEIEGKWKTHTLQCKSSTASNGFLGRQDAARRESAQQLSDALLETHYVEEIAALKFQVQDLTLQKSHADNRVDRLEARMQELEEEKIRFAGIERDLRLELKQAVQQCAETEAKRHADMVLWRTRVMELTTELTELRQNNLQLECNYEGLVASQKLSNGADGSDFERLSVDKTSTSRNATPSSVTTVWKDIPSTLMTDSIGPLDELCLVPDDPLITSVYINSKSNSSECC